MKVDLKSFLGGAASVLLVLAVWWLADGGGGETARDPATTVEVAASAATEDPATTTTAGAPTTRRSTTTRRPTTTVRPAPGGFVAVEVGRLPIEARQTLALIDRGGPYPYRADDGVFQNREGLLPDYPRGYYHEYTVETPGSPDRGARRIVTGEGGELYYTEDHYDSFRWVLR